jgi:hypothetical protein
MKTTCRKLFQRKFLEAASDRADSDVSDAEDSAEISLERLYWHGCLADEDSHFSFYRFADLTQLLKAHLL